MENKDLLLLLGEMKGQLDSIYRELVSREEEFRNLEKDVRKLEKLQWRISGALSLLIVLEPVVIHFL